VEVDESIVQLGERLDAWCNGFFGMLDSEDRLAQSKALLAGIEIFKELDRLKAEGLAAIRALLARQDTMPDDERSSSLIRGFEFAARLSHTLRDELRDTTGKTKVVRLMNTIADTLDTLGPGRSALAVLLDNSDAGVRASAGAYLINLMPERVIPIMQEVQKNEDASSAFFTAYWTVRCWELEGKAGSK
jgi:hypothetical protein